MKEIEVKTNLGKLIATEVGDTDYPAIGIYLETKEGRILLNVTEVNQTDYDGNILETYIYDDMKDEDMDPERIVYKNL